MLLGVLLWCRNSDVPAMPQTQRGANSHLDTFFSLWTLARLGRRGARLSCLTNTSERRNITTQESRMRNNRWQHGVQNHVERACRSFDHSRRVTEHLCLNATLETQSCATREIENHIEWSSARHHRDACVNRHQQKKSILSHSINQ